MTHLDEDFPSPTRSGSRSPHTLVKHMLDVICLPNLGQNLARGRKLLIRHANFGFASLVWSGRAGPSGPMVVEVATSPVAIQAFVIWRACVSSPMYSGSTHGGSMCSQRRVFCWSHASVSPSPGNTQADSHDTIL